MKHPDASVDLGALVACGDSIIYHLVKGDQVVYVGQSRVGIRRPVQHLGGHDRKDCDRIDFFRCDEAKLNETELAHIAAYKPKLNRVLPPFVGNLIRTSEIRKELVALGKSQDEVKAIIEAVEKKAKVKMRRGDVRWYSISSVSRVLAAM